MYTAKYESGSKGKCIQLGDEWLTPNEFEDRAGSKAKKYLSSIKCLGRPLRVFVNSGELKGSGPPPAPKIQKKVKPSPMQPIAPAPPPGTGMLTPGPQMGQIATAPPTPSHISNAPPIPKFEYGDGWTQSTANSNQSDVDGVNHHGSKPGYDANYIRN